MTTVWRDRRALYTDGLRRGAPQAVPVADRGHLVQNRRQALAAFRRDRRPAWQEAALGWAMPCRPTASPVPVTPMYRGRRWHPTPVPLREEAARPPRHTRGGASAAAVHARRVQGSPMASIARPLGISRPPGYSDLRRATPPGPRRLQRRPSARVLPPDVPSRLRRWRANGADRRQLWQELRARARVAGGRQADLAAVTAGLPLEWSNGVTEGHIQRLKRLKR